MVDHFSTYIYHKRGFYYFSRRVPKQLQHCHSKQNLISEQMRHHALPYQGYTDNNQRNANSASNALNKWLKSNFRDDKVIHGFRHAIRDRFRTIQCPSEIIDQIGGL